MKGILPNIRIINTAVEAHAHRKEGQSEILYAGFLSLRAQYTLH